MTATLQTLVDEEGNAFERLSHQWRPTDLIIEHQAKDMLKDMTHRYAQLTDAQVEFQKLDRADVYLKLVRKTKLVLRRATFVYRLNHLAFLAAVAEFYLAYGQILRFLKIDQARGLLSPEPV